MPCLKGSCGSRRGSRAAAIGGSLGERWSVLLYGDVGGFGVGSDLTYQAIAGVNWQYSKHISAKAGYRYLYQDFEKNGFV